MVFFKSSQYLVGLFLKHYFFSIGLHLTSLILNRPNSELENWELGFILTPLKPGRPKSKLENWVLGLILTPLRPGRPNSNLLELVPGLLPNLVGPDPNYLQNLFGKSDFVIGPTHIFWYSELDLVQNWCRPNSKVQILQLGLIPNLNFSGIRIGLFPTLLENSSEKNWN